MRSLRARVTLAAALASVLVLGLAGTVLVVRYRDHEVRHLDLALEAEAEQVAIRAFRYDPRHEAPYTGMGGDDPAMRARVYANGTQRGLVRYDDGEGWEPRVTAYPQRQEIGTRWVDFRGKRYREYVEEASIGNDRWGTPIVQVFQSSARLDARVARVRNTAVAAVAGAALLIGGLVWWLAGLTLGPLWRLVTGARELAAGDDLMRRLPVEDLEEAGELALSLNRLIERRQRALAHERAALAATRTFTADAGHELRTPLTSLRANLDVLARDDLSATDRDRSIRDALLAHTRLTALIESLQVLARGDVAAGHSAGPVDLAELADAAVLDARRRHAGVEFEFEGSSEAPVEGDPHGLRMLLDNLLENAAVHGGRRVRVHVRQGDGFARLSVDDDGPGIPDAEKGRVFERFSRGSAARNGTGSGLGLAIAAQQAELHGSRLRLDDSPLGGARFELLLSARAAS